MKTRLPLIRTMQFGFGVVVAVLLVVIIDLAHALKLKVVAEGVETEEQFRRLQALNCHEMQGYFFGRPAPSEIFEKRYLARSAG